MSNDVASNLSGIKSRVSSALLRAGRAEGDCELLAVSKTWPAENVAEVLRAGQASFGENKVQEAEQKVPALDDLVAGEDVASRHWHLIGGLQRNKARKALAVFQTIHSIDSSKLAKYTSNIALEIGVKPDVYLQVDLAAEERKSGFAPEVLRRELDELMGLQGFSIKGLMCIPPAVDTPEEARPWFVMLRELRDELEQANGVALPGLSMGMSRDFEVAIEEGSSIVRVGSAIFGSRSYL